jgi:Pro-kumamolisin, activation domain
MRPSGKPASGRGAPAGLVILAALALGLGALGAASASAVPRSTKITFYFGLARPEAKARAAFFAVGQPGSPTYRHFLTLQQVAALYGAAQTTRTAFVRAARQLGFSARVDASGVFARVAGTVGRFERVFHVRIRREFNNDVLANGYFVAQVRKAYGLDALGSGAGASVAILNAGEGLTAGDIADAADCFGLPALKTRTLLTDGQARAFGRGSFEPQEDLALARGMAPGIASATFVQVCSRPSCGSSVPRRCCRRRGCRMPSRSRTANASATSGGEGLPSPRARAPRSWTRSW